MMTKHTQILVFIRTLHTNAYESVFDYLFTFPSYSTVAYIVGSRVVVQLGGLHRSSDGGPTKV